MKTSWFAVMAAGKTREECEKALERSASHEDQCKCLVTRVAIIDDDETPAYDLMIVRKSNLAAAILKALAVKPYDNE